MIANYLEKKSTDNEIIEKLLENNELRDKYEKQLLEFKKEEPLVRLKSVTNQQSITTISVNNPVNSNNQSIIMKTLNTGRNTSNQTQIKTTDALRNLITAANTNNTNTTNINLKQVILTNKSTTPKVILVPNNNVKNNQIEDLTNITDTTIISPIQQQQHQTPPIVQYQLSSSLNNTRVIMPKITTISTTNTNSYSPQKLVYLKSSNNIVDTKSLKIITQPINKNHHENSNETQKQQQQQFLTTQTSKPIILNNNLNHLKESYKIHNNEVLIYTNRYS